MKILTLKHPIKLGEKAEVTQLKFREYTTAADYLSFDQRGGVAQRISLIASLTGNDESLIQKLHGGDYRRAEKLADDLMAADEDEAAQDSGKETPKEQSPEELAIEKK